jgi:hypothetical protein
MPDPQKPSPRSFLAAYNAHRVEEMLAVCTDDVQLRYVPMGNQGQGKVRDLGKTNKVVLRVG